MYRNGFVFRLIGALLLIGLMVGGGFMAYRAGITQGIAQAPAVATAISKAAENGQAAPVPVPPVYGYGYGYPYAWGYPFHFGFFPFGICGSILFVFFFFGLLRMVFFRPWGWGYYGHRHHRHPWGGPPWMRPEDEEADEKKAESSKETM